MITLLQTADQQAGSGTCGGADAKVREAESVLGALPRSVDSGVRQGIADGMAHLRDLIQSQCQKPGTQTTTTPTQTQTTQSQTQTTETQTSATETTPTQTGTNTNTTTTTTPTDTTTTQTTTTQTGTGNGGSPPGAGLIPPGGGDGQ